MIVQTPLRGKDATSLRPKASGVDRPFTLHAWGADEFLRSLVGCAHQRPWAHKNKRASEQQQVWSGAIFNERFEKCLAPLVHKAARMSGRIMCQGLACTSSDLSDFHFNKTPFIL